MVTSDKNETSKKLFYPPSHIKRKSENRVMLSINKSSLRFIFPTCQLPLMVFTCITPPKVIQTLVFVHLKTIYLVLFELNPQLVKSVGLA